MKEQILVYVHIYRVRGCWHHNIVWIESMHTYQLCLVTPLILNIENPYMKCLKNDFFLHQILQDMTRRLAFVMQKKFSTEELKTLAD